jgi:hypothetical protein
MDADKLDELERLLKAAPDMRDLRVTLSRSGRWAAVVQPDGRHICGIAEETPALFPDDAALITAAINALPELVARAKELDAARAELAGVREAVEPGMIRVTMVDARGLEAGFTITEEAARRLAAALKDTQQ